MERDGRVPGAGLSDLLDIGEAIGAADNKRASKFVALCDACESLALMPIHYPLIPCRESQGIRRGPHGNYLILYITDRRDVTIVRILHGARNYERLLIPGVRAVVDGLAQSIESEP